ncbi:MAG: hypothetical protein PHS06_00675 [Candidatus Shapirobacteria bacterium]|nr:hypothetical protein [Candidatus Shapirobacteria bacterium]
MLFLSLMSFRLSKSTTGDIFYIQKYYSSKQQAVGQTNIKLKKNKLLCFPNPIAVTFIAKKEFTVLVKNHGSIREVSAYQKDDHFLAEGKAIEFKNYTTKVNCSFYFRGEYSINTLRVAGDVILFAIIILLTIISILWIFLH